MPKVRLLFELLLAICTANIQSAWRGRILLTARKWIMHLEVMFTLWGFCTGKFQRGGQNSWSTQVHVGVSKASVKAFEPRISRSNHSLIQMPLFWVLSYSKQCVRAFLVGATTCCIPFSGKVQIFEHIPTTFGWTLDSLYDLSTIVSTVFLV